MTSASPLSTVRAVCPGSFDPFHLGHLDVVRRAAAVFAELVVLVLANPAKPGRFALAERVRLIEESLAAAGVSGARVVGAAGGLLVDHCRELGAGVVVKGVRGPLDLGYETPMAVRNRQMTGVETLFLPCAPELSHVSSSLVAELAALGGPYADLVPAPVAAALASRA
ncbi:MAG: pantetheine-phosphate adenylyltransferase [Kineosporiaceae bacterium]